mgnify:CR=1 FL=1
MIRKLRDLIDGLNGRSPVKVGKVYPGEKVLGISYNPISGEGVLMTQRVLDGKTKFDIRQLGNVGTT